MKAPRRFRIGQLFAGMAIVALVSALMAGLAPGARAQEATPTAAAGSIATVSVSGHGSVLVPPDTASVVVGVDVIEKTLGEAQDGATKQMNAIIRALKAAGVKEEDIQTVNYSVNIMRSYDSQTGTPGPITGYEVMNQVNVTVRNLDQLGSLLDTVVSKGANSIYGINFYVADPTDAASQARTQAVQDAKKKAQELAAAAGMQLGRVLSISEGAGSSSPIPYATSKTQGAGGAPIQAGTSEIDVDVQMTFELIGS